MTNAAQDIKIVEYGTPDGHQMVSQPVKGSETLYGGTVAVTRSGYLVNPTTPAVATDIVWGLIHKQVTNPVTNDGAIQCDIETGTFYLSCATSTDALVQTDIGAVVYLVDNRTIGKTNGGSARPIAGTLMNIDLTQPGGYAIRLGSTPPGTGSP
jgi:hypothetical protein